ncbi:protein kinase [Streptomyces sp. NPDC002067]
MERYAGRVLAERYRLPLRPGGGDGATAFRALDTLSSQEVLLRQVPLPEVVEAEFADAAPGGWPGAGRAGAAREAPRDPRDPVVRRAFLAATRAAELPDHPLLDQVFDVFVADGSLWIAGELIAARPLAALLAEGPLAPQRAAEIGADVLTALRALHARGWVHRNVTDRTVLICDDGRAVLSGLAAGAAQEALCGTEPMPLAAPAVAVPPARGPEPEGGAGEPAGASPTGPGASPTGPAEAGPSRTGAAPAVLTKGGAAATGPAGGVPAPAGPAPVGSAPALPVPVDAGPGAGGLLAGRVREMRLAVVGPVTERWAPEQAAPAGCGGAVGSGTDLWALGALLFRCVQGRPPYPEESAAELARMVCAHRPAPAGACGPLRPAVEALLGPDPAARPAPGPLLAVLREVTRGAPEPERDGGLVTLPARGAGTDPGRLPVVRRRGELVRKEKKGRGAAPARTAPAPKRPGRTPRAAAAGQEPPGLAASAPGRAPKPPRARGPRHLGRLLLVAILLLVAGAVAFAVLFLPKAGEEGRGRTGAGAPSPSATAPGGGRGGPEAGSPQTTTPAGLATGFAVRKDPAGFQIAVRKDWQRRGPDGQGRIRYAGGGYELLVVPGRDTVAAFGADPLAYQQDKEPELAAYRASSWATASGLRRMDVGRTAMAEGGFSWKDGGGREVYARNFVMIHQGRYHLVQVSGPKSGSRTVDRLYDQATGTYRPN